MAESTYGGFTREFYSQLVLIILAALTFRLAISTWGHSGEGKPPMYGDFEAQRHWMEVTTNLPAQQWYVNTSANNLQYWGLDYPPLTAYHMMVNGKIAQKIYPEMVTLHASRGIETQEVKFFMRLSVLLMDALIFLPAAVAYFVFRQPEHVDERNILTCIMVVVFYPGLALIDNGHFQFNNVSLGLVVLATLALSVTFDIAAAILFCLALNYKQMELYHAMPFFAYLLGRCFRLQFHQGLFKLASLGVVVIGTFALVWAPFLMSLESFQAVLTRLFPFNRGLYEDKVANFWCSVSPVIKFKDILAPQSMARVCLVVTGLLVLPSFLDLLRHPTLRKFHYASINISLIFFLFSFHVHEKSILIAAVPSCLVIDKDPLMVVWFLIISVFSMLPLLVKDGLLIPAIASLCVFWMGVNHFLKPTTDSNHRLVNTMHLSLLGAVCLTLASLTVPPPPQLPDLFQLLIAVYACAHFFLFAFYFHSKQFGGESEKIVWELINGSSKSKTHSDSKFDRLEDEWPESGNTISRKQLKKRR